MNRVEPNRNVYVGHRYVPLLVGEWDKSIQYEGLSIVTFKGGSYTSKKMTPPGIDIENEEYWVFTANYDAQVEYYRQETKRVKEYMEELDDRLTKDLSDTRAYVDDEVRKNREYVDTSVQDLTIYVNNETASARQYVDDETASARQYVDDSVAENKTYVDGEVESLTNHVNTNVDNVNQRITDTEENMATDMTTLQNQLLNELDNIGTTTFRRGSQNTLIEVETPFKSYVPSYNSRGLLSTIEENGERKNIRTNVNRTSSGIVESYDREEF